MATRAKPVERIFGGLDKMYLIHRRSGIIAVFLLLAHFITVPRDLTAFTLGKPLGFYAFMLIIIGVILSAAPIFKKKIPYHKWINFHRLMGIFYIMAVLHALMVYNLIKELPLTRVYVFGMSALGVGAWFYRAFLYYIFNKKYSYTITKVHNVGDKMVEVYLKADGDPLHYRAGQFAFFKFPGISKREQHPFTISSHPSEDQMRIIIKDLGDYTATLADTLKLGDTAELEGPFGHFTNQHVKKEKQIWVAGGIGITPFLSLAKEITNQKVDLFWCVHNEESAIYKKEIDEITSVNSNLNFTVWVSSKKGHLSANQLNVENFQDYAYMICGPEKLKHSLYNQLRKEKVNKYRIYDEEFAFR